MSFWYVLAALVHLRCLLQLQTGFAPFREALLIALELQLAYVEAIPKDALEKSQIKVMMNYVPCKDLQSARDLEYSCTPPPTI